MTHEEIDAMPEGRALNILVAEKVMGWTHIITLSPNPESRATGMPPGYSENEVWRRDYIPPYSTDIAAAWRVVQKFDHYSMESTHFDDKPHLCELSRSKPEGYGRGWGETPMLAICRAALKAML